MIQSLVSALRTKTALPPNPDLTGVVVVKVGGSLYDLPFLGPGLNSYLTTLGSGPTLLVPGGGSFADAVRALDRWHNLGEEKSHQLAVSALEVAGQFLTQILDGVEFSTSYPAWWKYPVGPVGVLSGHLFMTDYEQSVGPVPHTWKFTSDSIAAICAKVANARLILLKSIDIPPGTPWPDAAAQGWVDAYFPTAVADAAFPIEAINFRRWLDEHPTESPES